MQVGAIVDEKEAFQAIARAHLARLYGTAKRLLGDDAEDAVQETLMKAYQNFGQLHDRDAAGAWLAQILVNCCRDRGRRLSRGPAQVDIDSVEEFSLYRKIAHEDPFPYSDSLHLDFLHRFGKEDVTQVLLRLPHMYRVPLVLVHMDGFATKEVAKMLDIPLGTVLARLHRGRKLFEKTMWNYAEEQGMLKEGAR
ncbi:MAG TPA: sigma-70 family RNA polymerase sigma factor [Actinomycetota bacterium]|nr:sigma-70 family RNA polymerase sigma factor [Actinomycetota bacterium]